MSIRKQFIAALGGLLAFTPVAGPSTATAQQSHWGSGPYQPVNCSSEPRTSGSALLYAAGRSWDVLAWTLDPQKGSMHGHGASSDHAEGEPAKFSIDIDATFDPVALKNFNPANFPRSDDDHPLIPTQITRVAISHVTGDAKNPIVATVYNFSNGQPVLDQSATSDQTFKAMPLTGRLGVQSIFGSPAKPTVWISANDAVTEYALQCNVAPSVPAQPKPAAAGNAL